MLPPSDAAKTLSGSIMASAPKTQSPILKPVRPRAAHAAGETMLVIVPSGAVTSITRNIPSLVGISPGSTERMAA